jgi:hypothetical protein
MSSILFSAAGNVRYRQHNNFVHPGKLDLRPVLDGVIGR